MIFKSQGMQRARKRAKLQNQQAMNEAWIDLERNFTEYKANMSGKWRVGRTYGPMFNTDNETRQHAN